MDLIPNVSMETWLLFATILVLLYFYGTSSHRLFKKQGIPGPKPLPFFGTSHHYGEDELKFYLECNKKYGKIWGLYEGRQPVLAITDPAMIKKVLLKESYSVFSNRPVNAAILLINAIIGYEDREWKKARKLLSANLTSGRLKDMFPIIQQTGDTMLKNLRREAEKDKPVGMKDIMGAYVMDVVINTLLGMNIDSLNNPQDPFIKSARELSNIERFYPLLFSVARFPFLKRIYDILNISIFPSDAVTCIQHFIRRTKKDRLAANEEHQVDFLQLMMNTQNPKNMESHTAPSDLEIEGNLMLLLFAGNLTLGTSLTFAMYALATHPDIQKKLQGEIDAALPNKAPATYDAVVKMEYLDMVVSEILRLYPITVNIQRMCNKDVEINGVFIPKRTVVMVPVFALHRDPIYWSEPEEFRPERFCKKNKERMDPYIYLPFGMGPMNCIGMSFAVLNMKLVVVKVLQNFSLQVCKETQASSTDWPFLCESKRARKEGVCVREREIERGREREKTGTPGPQSLQSNSRHVTLKFWKNMPPRPEKPILLKVVSRDGTINGI